MTSYTHPDQILRYVSIVSEGPPKLKQSCDDVEEICRGHKKPAIGTCYMLLNVGTTTSEF